MRRRLLAPLLVIAALAGCAGMDYEAQGDFKYSQGDYYGAVDSYKRVPPGDGSPELPAKTRKAEGDLIEDAVVRAQRALDDGRFEEALKISRRALDYKRDERLLAFEQASKRQTVSNAVELGKLHLQRQEFDEAIAQFETALRYESSATTQGLLLDAKAGAARKLAQEARRLLAAKEFDAALDTINRAIALHEASEHQSLRGEITTAKERWLTQQFDQARARGMAAVAKTEYSAAVTHFQTALRYRSSAEVQGRVTYCEAMAAGTAALAARDLAEADRRFREALATNFDSGAAQRQINAIEQQRNAMIADAAKQRQNGDYEAAVVSLQSAITIRPDAQLDAWIRYCNHMIAAGNAVKAKDFGGAKAAFELALAEGLDDGGVAARYRDGVRTSTYTITLQSMTIKPFKANDEVWDGSLRRALPLGRILAGFQSQRGAAAGKKAADLAATLLPPQNLPDIFVRIETPDGGVYRSDVNTETLYANIGAAFTVTGHAFSDAPVVILVRDKDGDKEEGVGTWRTTVGKLITGDATGSVQFEQVFDLTYTVELKSEEPTKAWTSGVTVEKEPTPAPAAGTGEGTDPAAGTGAGTDPAAGSGNGSGTGNGTGTTEAPAATRWTITLNEIQISAMDIPTKRGDPIADAEFEIHLGDTVVMSAYAGDDRAGKRWRPAQRPTATISIGANDKLKLRLADRDANGADVIIEYEIDQAGLAQGAIRLETENRSLIDLTATKQK